MIVQIVRFKSALTDKEVEEKYKARSGRYRAARGLLQKYYLKYPETGEHGAVYVWESEAAMKEFRSSNLAGSIAETYQVQGASEKLTGEVVMTLYPEVSASKKAVTIGRR